MVPLILIQIEQGILQSYINSLQYIFSFMLYLSIKTYANLKTNYSVLEMYKLPGWLPANPQSSATFPDSTKCSLNGDC